MYSRAAYRTVGLLTVGWACASAAVAAPSLVVTADRPQIYLYESFQLTLRVQDAEAGVGEAKFDTASDASFEFLGSSNESFFSRRTVNGRTTQEAVQAQVLTYRVTPRAAGDFVLRRVTIDVGGHPLQTAGPSVRVVGVEAQDLVQVELTASRDTVLVEEPFDVVLTVTVKRLPAPNERFDPFAPDAAPRLDIPYLAQPAPKGLRGPDATTVLQPLLTNPRNAFGFAINGLTVGSFMWSEPARFALSREETTWDGAPAWRYRLAVPYTPEQEGSYSFGPARFKGQAIRSVKPNGTPNLQDVFAVAPPTTVRVVPPPEEGRPASFIGALGSELRAEARLDTQTCQQGDPLRLTLDLTGDITLANLRAPTLSRLPELASSFRVYDDAVRSEPLPRGRRFVYTVRPLVAGTIEVPPIPVSFYGKEDRRYHTVTTDPIPLRVEAVAQFDPADIIETAPDAGERATSIRVQSARTVLAAITVSPDGAADGPALLPSPLAVWLLVGPGLAGLATAARWAARHRVAWRRNHRRRFAARRAARRLRRARSGAEALRAVARFFEDRYETAAAGFSPLDARGILQDHGVDPELVAAVVVELQALFDDAFRPGDPDPQLLARARRTLPALLARCGTQPPSSP